MMHLTQLSRYYLAPLILITMIASPVEAQSQSQQDRTPPKPAARVYSGLIGGQDQTDQNSQTPALTPDATPLTGAQDFTLGIPEARHSYWVPGFSFQNAFQSNANGINDWGSSSYFLGNLTVSLNSTHSQFGLNYSGGGSVTNSSVLPSSYYHALSFSQSFNWGRWQFQFLDQFSYLPQSSFGFGGIGGISLPGVSGGLGASFPGLQTNYMPGQSLFSSDGPRINNSFVTQADYALSARSSLTAVASYGVLHFTKGDAIDTDDAIFSLGYNYQMTRADTLGLLYRFSAYRYSGNAQALNDHTANLAYGRKITGRLALQLFGGPDVRTYRQPIGSATESVSFSAGALVTYDLKRTGLTLSYSHGLSGGSGILIGSIRDRVDGRVSFHLSRQWLATEGFGVARNGTIPGSSTTGGSQNIDALYVSSGLTRPLGRTANLSFSYIFGYQNTSQPVCPLGGCGTGYTQHHVWVGFQWHTRPFVIR